MRKVFFIWLWVAAVVILSTTMASAQSFVPMKPLSQQDGASQPEIIKLNAQQQDVMVPANKISRKPTVSYHRPAGAFYGAVVVDKSGDYQYLNVPYLCMVPGAEYTFHGICQGFNEFVFPCWKVQQGGQWSTIRLVDSVTVSYSEGVTDSVPIFLAEEDEPGYYLDTFFLGGMVEGEWPRQKHPSLIAASNNPGMLLGYELLKSGKNFCFGGMDGSLEAYTQAGQLLAYYGLNPSGNNEYGWYFGKNAGKKSGVIIDGIAQAFEEPQNPYPLRGIAMEVSNLHVTDTVNMTCKVYQLDEIPQYSESGYVTLPEEPHKLLASGIAKLQPIECSNDRGLILFDLIDKQGHPTVLTIDSSILVVVEGYNEPEMSGLADFTALVSMDFNSDEGFGEMAYLKWGTPDENGDTLSYQWRGLNNSLYYPMKTGFTIFLDTSLPPSVSSPSPDINYVITSDAVNITATGEGMVKLYIDGEEVTNPYSAPRAEDDYTVTVTATAEASGMLVSEPAELELTIPAIGKECLITVTAYEDTMGCVTAQHLNPLPNGQWRVTLGCDVDFVVQPYEGYELSALYVDGTDILSQVDAEGLFTLNNVAGDTQIDAYFVPMNSYTTLVIKQSDLGDVALRVTCNEPLRLNVTADPTWTIHSVTLNGKDITKKLDGYGDFTIRKVDDVIVVGGNDYVDLDPNEPERVKAFVAFANNSGIAEAKTSHVRVLGEPGGLRIEGLPANQVLTVVDVAGHVVARHVGNGYTITIALPSAIYIVSTKDLTVKIHI